MPSSASLVPSFDVAVHIVLDDFGKHGRAYRETDGAAASFDTVVILTGQYKCLPTGYCAVITHVGI